MSHQHPGASPSMNELLDLEVLDRNLFRGVNEQDPDAPAHLYGGQIAAQALRAAGLTVAPDRHPHSLHGYFLRAGQRAKPVIFEVDRDRDGRSFSARRVVAVQDGEVIFDMTCSFHIDEFSGTYTAAMPADLPPPEDHSTPKMRATVGGALAAPIPPIRNNEWGEPGSNRFWVRTRDQLPDDRLIQACALTYLSDIGTGFLMLDVPDLPLGGSSLDHAMWFRAPVRADEWCVLDMTPVMAGGARGLYTGTIHAADGTLAATIAQEVLLRPATVRPSTHGSDRAL